MSLVGVLKPGSGADVEVIALHINFWALTVPFTPTGLVEVIRRRGTRKAFVDVGVRFRVNSGTLGSLTMLFPPSTIARNNIEDLSSLVLDERINDLIFGVLTTTKERTVHYRLAGDPVSDVVVSVAKASSNRSGATDLTFETNIAGSPTSPTYYMRVRIECQKNSPLLNSKDWGFAKQGFVFRCLMNDVRATAEARENRATVERLLPVGASFVFLIAPSDFIPVLSSPALHYSRLLEASVWREYLQSCGTIGKNHKYTIHQWRGTSQITEQQPFRAYMHLHREFGLGVRMTYLIGLATLPALGLSHAVAKHFGLLPGWLPTF